MRAALDKVEEFWRQKGAHSCFCTIQDIHAFFEWLANRLVHLKSGRKASVKAQQYVAKLAKFQGVPSQLSPGLQLT
ncbi:hypothetical protein WJX77_009221 [Trebouxia sp. C0004]